MSGPSDLYKRASVEHSKHPRNEGRRPEAKAEAATINPLCGDKVTVRAVVEDGRLVTLRFEGRGCAIALASASMMTELLEGKTVEEGRDTAELLKAVVRWGVGHSVVVVACVVVLVLAGGGAGFGRPTSAARESRSA